jgi:hypothetical protein
MVGQLSEMAVQTQVAGSAFCSQLAIPMGRPMSRTVTDHPGGSLPIQLTLRSPPPCVTAAASGSQIGRYVRFPDRLRSRYAGQEGSPACGVLDEWLEVRPFLAAHSRRCARGRTTRRGIPRAGWSPWPGESSSTTPAPMPPGGTARYASRASPCRPGRGGGRHAPAVARTPSLTPASAVALTLRGTNVPVRPQPRGHDAATISAAEAAACVVQARTYPAAVRSCRPPAHILVAQFSVQPRAGRFRGG